MLAVLEAPEFWFLDLSRCPDRGEHTQAFKEVCVRAVCAADTFESTLCIQSYELCCFYTQALLKMFGHVYFFFPIYILCFRCNLESISNFSSPAWCFVKRLSRAHGRHVGVCFLRKAFCPFLQPWTPESHEIASVKCLCRDQMLG